MVCDIVASSRWRAKCRKVVSAHVQTAAISCKSIELISKRKSMLTEFTVITVSSALLRPAHDYVSCPPSGSHVSDRKVLSLLLTGAGMHAPTCHATSQALHLQRLQQSSTALPSHASVPSAIQPAVFSRTPRAKQCLQRSSLCCQATLTLEAPAASPSRVNQGHAALRHGLGQVGNVPPTLMPWLLRLAHIRYAQAAHATHCTANHFDTTSACFIADLQ